MIASQPRFYQTGGTLPPDAPSYVERHADQALYDGLSQGEFCYVLTARQMGKSSLTARTLIRLRQEGVAAAGLDLTAVGQNLSVAQWYDGLLGLLGQQLNMEDELEEYWLDHERQSPLQRWMGALREVVLARCPGRVVIFIDEIDAVRSLPFSTDEFFAAIRECYNRRSQDPAYERLTFCLLGVASPSDLIRDTRTTPFNIGRRIELTDFTEGEAAPLAQGLGRDAKTGQALLERVLYWTGGHPYLTQRLCRAVAEDAGVSGPAGVDRLCEELFLSPRAREQDDNLLFVRERLLRSEVDLAGLLDLYGQVARGKRVPDDEADPLVSLLRLSGIARAVDGHLRVRNQIYRRVFDREWVSAHMPDAELRRQRAAYLRGLFRATVIAGVMLSVVVSLGLTALHQARLADRNLRMASNKAEELKRLAAMLQRSLDERDKLFTRLVALDQSFSLRRGKTTRGKMAETAGKARTAQMARKVLVVDDEQDIVRLLEKNLVGAGYQVMTAFDGPEALQKAGVEKPDLVVLDDLMPTMDGSEVLRRLKASQATAEIPVIMMAERAKPSDVFRGYQQGVDAYLTKPINPAELLAFVKQILDSQAGLAEAGREIPIKGDENALIRIAHTILQQAIDEGASEIHVEPRAERLGIYFRLHSGMNEVLRLPKHIQRNLVARYKLMADLNPEEHNAPQEGRIGISYQGKEYDLRVHSEPTSNGERVVIAISAKQ
jgi:DNA-binding response OmpR family regulator